MGRTVSQMIEVPAGEESTLQVFVEKWKDKDQIPPEAEMRAMAKCLKLQFYHFSMLFGERVRFAPVANTPQSPPKGSSAAREVDAQTGRYIREYIDQHRGQACNRGMSSGRYRCTWGCGYSTSNKDSWRQHEETKQPQEFFICTTCPSTQDRAYESPRINHRPDKFLEHVQKCHPREDAMAVRDASRIEYAAPFDRQCTYKLRDGNACGHNCSSWRERKKHWIKHFDDEADDAPPSKSSPGKEPDSDGEHDDQEDHLGSKRSKSSSKSRQRHKTASNSRQAKKGLKSTGSRKIVASVSQIPPTKAAADIDSGFESLSWGKHRTSTVSKPVPLTQLSPASCFLDVESRDLIEAQLNARFIALKSNHTEDDTLQASMRMHASATCTSSLMGEEEHYAWKIAAKIARAMGIRYIWIDFICGPDTQREQLEAIYQQAVLILVTGWCQGHSRDLSHLACTYSQLDTVQSWVQQGVAIRHLRPLGHGAYSFVDKVEVNLVDRTGPRVSSKSFARKVIFRSTGSKRDAGRAAQLHEIEIMNKFNHPHIAQFVAAYYEDSYLNILMSPVAECDLSQVLNDPSTYTPHILPELLRRWFLSLAQALAHIHGHRCRHKDIKPANILVSNNEVLLSDFGTSLEFDNDESVSTGDAFMTPKYCAPEVAARGRRGRGADIWSLGCVFLEMATVMEGRTLSELHATVRIRTKSKERRDTYHQQQPALIDWLSLLEEDGAYEGSCVVLRITKRMLSNVSEERPSAVEVVRILCGDNGCDLCARTASTATGIGCHCCVSDLHVQAAVNLSDEADRYENLAENSTLTLFSDTSLNVLKDTRLPTGITSDKPGKLPQQKSWTMSRQSTAKYTCCGKGNPWMIANGKMLAGPWASQLLLLEEVCVTKRVREGTTPVSAESPQGIDAICKVLFWIHQGRDGQAKNVALVRLMDKILQPDEKMSPTATSNCGLIQYWCEAHPGVLADATNLAVWVIRFDRDGRQASLVPGSGGENIGLGAVSKQLSIASDIQLQRKLPLMAQEIPPRRLIDLEDETPCLLETRGARFEYVA